jgi:hypothetical protein
LVGGGMGKKQPSLVADAEPPDDPGAGDGGPDHGDGAGELALEHTACMPRSSEHVSSVSINRPQSIVIADSEQEY